MSMTLNGQNLSEHQWQNRVILIISNDTESELHASQLKEFNTNSMDFKERKLVVYSILPNKYKIENGVKGDWIYDTALYSKYNPSNKKFQVILIGLDGGIKFRQNKVLTTTNLFSMIDAMPMRRSEVRDN